MNLKEWFSRKTPPMETGLEGVDVVNLRDAMAENLLRDLLKERREDRRWSWFKRIVISGAGLVLFIVYMAFYVTSLGYKIVPKTDLVGVVRLEGEISAGSNAGADEVIPVLDRVFRAPNVKAVVLLIDSPGGAPAESERINNFISQVRKEHDKPYLAVISNTGASAAYMVAAHADKIIAGKYSLVGSIGAVMAGWDVHKVLEKNDVAHHVFTSGPYKAMLNPFVPLDEANKAKATELVSTMGKTFADEIRQVRGAKLKKQDFATGEVWNGTDALAIGLIDEVNTIDNYIRTNWPDVKVFEFGPKKEGKSFPALGFIQEAITEGIARVFAPIANQAIQIR